MDVVSCKAEIRLQVLNFQAQLWKLTQKEMPLQTVGGAKINPKWSSDWGGLFC